VGSRAHRERIAVEARPAGVTADGGKVHAATCAGSTPRDQRWSTFLRNHARAIVACDFCIAVTSTFRVLYVLVVIEHHSRRLIHVNVTAHPTAQWTRQQLREVVGYEQRYAYLLHDRDSIFSASWMSPSSGWGYGF